MEVTFAVQAGKSSTSPLQTLLASQVKKCTEKHDALIAQYSSACGILHMCLWSLESFGTPSQCSSTGLAERLVVSGVHVLPFHARSSPGDDPAGVEDALDILLLRLQKHHQCLPRGLQEDHIFCTEATVNIGIVFTVPTCMQPPCLKPSVKNLCKVEKASCWFRTWELLANQVHDCLFKVS